MFESGHARLLVAFIAAMGLHGLFFVWQSPQLEAPVFPSMQVEFLAQAHVSSSVEAKPSNTHKPTLQPVQKEMLNQQRVLTKKTIHKPEIYQKPVEPLEPKLAPKIAVASTEVNAKPKRVVVLKNDAPLQEQADMQSGKDTDMVMPIDIQKRILTRVSYPMRARRRGWEGRAEFRINVRAKGIQHVTMLLSTGYDLLDHAAQKGIVSIGLLPLSDGSYRFPVVFRLQ